MEAREWEGGDIVMGLLFRASEGMGRKETSA